MLRILYLIGAVIFTVLILLIGFANVNATCNLLVIFFTDVSPNTSPAILIFLTAFIGAITGFFYTSLFHSLFKNDDDDDNEQPLPTDDSSF